MKPGDPVLVRGGSHMYLDGWVRGQEPTYIRNTLIALVLGDEVESDTVNPRTFLRILTPHGIGKINSAFCEEVRCWCETRWHDRVGSVEIWVHEGHAWARVGTDRE